LTVFIQHCAVLGALCRVLSSATVVKVCGDRQTAGCCLILDWKRFL